MKRVIAVILFACLVLASVSVSAKEESGKSGIVYTSSAAMIKNGDMVISVTAVLDRLELKRKQSITLVPVLKSDDDAEGKEFRFAPITVAGRGREKSILRAISRGREHNTAAVLRRNNGHEQVLEFEMKTRFEAWQRNATLIFVEILSECAKCETISKQYLVGENMLPSAFEPVFRPSFELIPADMVRSNTKTFSGVIDFAAGGYSIAENYKNNAQELHEAGKLIENIANNPDITLEKIRIVGYSSPEGARMPNQKLSEKRAASLASYLMLKYGLESGVVEYSGAGEDWQGLRVAVDSSDISDKTTILNILDKASDYDISNSKLYLHDGDSYDFMLREIYPSLRRDEYTVTYAVRAFTPAEASVIIKSNPEFLGLAEMSGVAAQNQAGSSEYVAAYETAAKYYPQVKAIVNNLAAAKLHNGDADSAIELIKNDSSAVSLNNLGIAYFMKGDYESAFDYFTRSANAGNADAIDNLRQYEYWKADR